MYRSLIMNEQRNECTVAASIEVELEMKSTQYMCSTRVFGSSKQQLIMYGWEGVEHIQTWHLQLLFSLLQIRHGGSLRPILCIQVQPTAWPVN